MLDKLNYLKNFNPYGMIINHRNICYQKKLTHYVRKLLKSSKAYSFSSISNFFPVKRLKIEETARMTISFQYSQLSVLKHRTKFTAIRRLNESCEERFSVVPSLLKNFIRDGFFLFFFTFFNIPVLVALNSKHTGILL